MSVKRSRSWLLLLWLTMIGGPIGEVCGQSKSPTPAVMVKTANGKADAKLKALSNSWQQKLSQYGTQARFRLMAKDIIGFDEKVAQGFEFVDGKSKVVDRMRASFRKRIVDERTLAAEMQQSFAKFQKGLIGDSTELYVKAGVSRGVASSIYPEYGVDYRPWLIAFDPILKKAETLSKQDWVRAGGVQAASYFGGEGLADAARETGLWAPKKGSWLDIATGIVADMVVEEALDQITDPSDEFAKQLRTRFAVAQNELLYGKQGLIRAAKRVAELHKQTRLKHFAPVLKGGR